MEERIEVDVEAKQSIYKAVRMIKRRENSLYNALRSIYEDSIFVNEISQLWPKLPLLANLRCGLWYSPRFHSTCYFKSTDGHTNNLSFSTSRLNLHVALLAGQKGGCIIVDSTRKGKRFPDSMSKTIPIWTCVLNRAVAKNRRLLDHSDGSATEKNGDDLAQGGGTDETDALPEWDCSLHLPLWVSDTERAKIEGRLEDWTNELEASGADIALAGMSLRKPLRPLWISQRTVIWLNEVPDHESWDFTPIILLSASCSSGLAQPKMISEFSWNYIAGAGDDEESWARGLAPPLFWKHAHDIIDAGPELCNRKIADIVEENRVYRAQRGYDAPQIKAKASKLGGLEINKSHEDYSHISGMPNAETDFASRDEACSITWLGSTNLSLGKEKSSCAKESGVASILNCSQEPISLSVENPDDYLHLPMMNSKFHRSSILGSLPCAVNFAKSILSKGKTLLVCCQNGEDISICVCLAILMSLYNDEGTYDDGISFRDKNIITKLDLRRRLVFICSFASNARPSRGNLKQVFAFLSEQKNSSERDPCSTLEAIRLRVMEGETNCDASSSGSASKLCSAQSLLKDEDECCSAQSLLKDEDECSYSFGSASNLQFRKVTSKGRWIGRLGMTEVLERKGQIWTTTGIVRDGNLYCLIEETLYLMEIGALSLIDENNLPLSLEQMYKNLAQAKGGYCWECFEAYRHLKSLGYIVGRHDIPWRLKSVKTIAGDVGDQERNESGEISSEQLVIEDFRDLYLDDPVPDFDVYLPNGRFGKSSPGDPNFYLCIARSQPPSKLEIEALERKHGSIPLRFCQVDNGRVSFFSFSKVDLPILP